MSSVNELLQSLGREKLERALIDWILMYHFVLEAIQDDSNLEQLGADYAAPFADFYQMATALVMLDEDKTDMNEYRERTLDEGKKLVGDTPESVERKTTKAVDIAAMFKATNEKK